MVKDIRINQQWQTRSGSIVRVVEDRGPGAEDGWRWLLSNGSVAHEEDGRVIFFEGHQGPSDLVKLMEPVNEVTEEMFKAQDDMLGDD